MTDDLKDAVGMTNAAATGLTRRSLVARTGAVASLAIAAPVLAACSDDSSSGSTTGADSRETGSAPARIERADFVFPELPLALEGGKQVVQGAGVVLLGLEPLVLYDPAVEGSLAPNLASRFAQPSPTTVVLRLRDGVRFWDDTPLTIEDVLYSLRYHVDNPKSLLGRWWDLTRSIEAKGSSEIVIKLKNPDSQFLFALTFTPIMQKAFAEANAGKLGTPGVLNMGTGPWKFEKFVPDDHVELVANESYWGGKPNVERVIARLIADRSTALLALEAGDVTGDFTVSGREKSQYEGIASVRLQTGTNPEVLIFTLNQQVPPWDDVHLRRALQHAINRDACVEGALAGNGRAAEQLVDPEALAQVMSQAEIDEVMAAIRSSTEFDLEKAKAELAQSSVPDGVDFTVLIAPQYANIKRTLQILAEDFEQIGLTMTVKEVINSVYENSFDNKRYPVGAFTATPDSQSPVNLPAYFFPSDGAINLSHLDVPAMNDAMAELIATPPRDKAKAGALLAEVIKINASEAGYPSVWFADLILAIQSEYELRDFDAFWWSTRWPSFIAQA